MGNLFSSSNDDELSAARARYSSMQNELSSTRDELASTRALLSTTKNELSSTHNELSSTRERLSSTQNELSSTRARLETLNQEVENLTKDILGLETMKNKLIKVGELQEQVSSTKVEALTSKCNLQASRKVEGELKEEVLSRQKFEEDLEMKLQKVIEFEKQVTSVNEEVLSTKFTLEASIKEEYMLNEQLLGHEKIIEEMEMQLNMVMKLEKEFAYTNNKLLTTKGEFQASKKEENMLREQLQSCENLHRDMDTKLRMVLDHEKQLSFIKSEGLFVKASLEDLRNQEERLKKQLYEFENFQKDARKKLQKVINLEDEISSLKDQTLSAIINLESSKKEVNELNEKLSLLNKVQEVVVELKLL